MKKLLIPFLLAFMLMPAVLVAQTHYNVTVSSGSATSTYVPTNAYYNYSFTQAIYHPGEVGIDGTIDTIAFRVDANSISRNLTIYMAEVNKGSFSSGADAVPGSQFRQVFSGSVSFAPGWVYIPLDSVFAYADTADLVVAVIDGTGSYTSDYPSYLGDTKTETRSIYRYNDGSAYSLASPPNDCSVTSFLPMLKLGISSYSEYCATPDNLVVSGIVDDEAVITWHENGAATSWEVLISDTVVTDFSMVSGILVSDTTYTVTGLTGNTLYYVYVRANCGATSISGWSSASAFRSACMGSTSVPYTTGFEDLSTGEIPNCWMQVATGSSSAGSFPAAYSYASNAHNSNVYFEFESNSGQTEIVALPVMDDINTLQMTFYASVMNVNFTFEVGVMEDSLFVPVDTVALTAGSGNNWGRSYYPYTVYFTDYSGTGDRIAMRVVGSGSYTLMLDDLTVEEVPSCLTPTHLRLDSLGMDWAALGWHENGTASDWEVIYDTLPFNPDTAIGLTPLSAYDTSAVLNGLTSGHTYYAYVRANCGDYSPWAGPITFIPGHYNMGMSGSDTVRSCGMVVYDDGGENDEYTIGSDFTLVIYPSSEDSIVTFWGTTDLYSYYASLRIYEGVGTDGTLLWRSSSNTNSDVIPFTRSMAGPITVRFIGGSYNYGYTGFELFTSCMEGPACGFVNNVIADNVGTSSVHATWNLSGTHFGTLSGYEVECVEVATNSTVATATPSAANVTIVGLTAATEYKLRVRAACDEGNGMWDSTLFTTAHMPCLAFDTSIHDSLLITSPSTTNTYNFPLNNYYGNTYAQQLILNEEMAGSTVISGIDFYYTGSSSNAAKTNCEIYLANTDYSSLASEFVPYDSNTFQLVYSGSMVCTTGWNHFEFTSPFSYDGSYNLLLAVVDNSGNYDGTAYTFQATSQSNLSRSVYSDYNTYDISTVSGGSTSEYRNVMRLHVAACTQEATCARPVVVVDRVDSNEVELTWAPGYQETSWGVEYRTESDSTWTAEPTATTTSHVFSSLTPDTRYYFRITALCGDTAMSTVVSARTQCESTALPFVYGFETFPTSGPQAPACWYKATNYQYSDYPYAVNSYAHSGSYSLLMYSYNESFSYVSLPVMNAAVDSLEVSFWMYSSGSYYENAVSVGVMSDPENPATFTSIATVYPTLTNTWEPRHVRLNTYHGTGNHIAIMAPVGTDDYAFIDDLTVDYIRPCARLENVRLDYITTDSAVVVWNGAGNNSFEVEYGPAGFVHDSGLVITTTVDTAVIAGLTPNTAYDVYVRTFCTDGDTSSWSNLLSFRTSCLLLDSLPYFEGFESVPSGMGTDYSEEFLPCWTRTYDAVNGYQNPYVDYYGVHTGSASLYWAWDSYDGINPIITLPAIDTNVLDINRMQLSFWAMNNSSYADVPELVVGVMTDPAVVSSFQVVDTVVVTSENWTLYEVPLDSYTGNGNYIAIMAGTTIGGGYWYANLDDFTLDTIPSCQHVTDLAVLGNTVSTITVGWTERGTSTEWEVAIDTLVTAIPTADTTVIDSNFVTINGLTSGTSYYVWVRSVCGAGDTSAWEGPIVAIPNSYTMVAGSTDTIYMCGGVVFDDGGSDHAYSNSQTTTLVIMPADSNSLVSVSGSSYTESTYDYLTIYDGAGTSGTSLWNDYGITSLTPFGPFTSTSGPITLVFQADGSVNYDGFTVHVDCIPTHCRVMGVRLNPAIAESSTQLSLLWNDNGATYYEVEYDTTGFTRGSGTMATTYTNNLTITGLSPLGYYDVYLRSICGVGDTGEWVKYSFQTAFCDGMTFAQSYSSSMTAATNMYAPFGTSNYNYSYVQTIIDSAQLVDLGGDISAFAFLPHQTDAGSYFTNITVYMANVPEDNLSMSYIYPDSTHQFVKVLDSADLSYTATEWQFHQLDTTFTWDGHSNLLLAVKRDHGTYTYGASFKVHSTSIAKTRYSYRDNSPYDITTVSGGSTGEFVSDLRFFSCNAVACPQPVIVGTTNDFESATITWTGAGNNYEVNIKETAAANWPTPDIAVAGNTYTFTGLHPATNYTFRVRQDCSADSLGYSEWTTGVIVTDSMPCLAPDSLQIVDVTNATVTVDWNVNGIENMWDVHVWSGTYDSIYRTSTHPATVGGMTAGMTYNVAVRALCGTSLIEGDWSAAIQFTTTTCPDVTGLTVGNVTAHSVTLNWETNPMAQSWIVEYGYSGFTQGQGSQAYVNTNSYEVTGLTDGVDYDFHVKAVCGTNWNSENWTSASATTLEDENPCYAPTGVTVNVVDNSATVSWTAGTGNVSFELEYGPQGFNHGAGTTVTTESTTTTLTGLDYGTQYDVYVRGICNDQAYSEWSAVSTFATDQVGIDNVDGIGCTIFPNPATATTTISVTGANGTVRISVVDMNGRTVATETLECSDDCVKSMDVDRLAQGTYFVRVTGDNVNMVKKLIVR